VPTLWHEQTILSLSCKSLEVQKATPVSIPKPASNLALPLILSG
jgi:hypothetical protein